MLAEVMSVLALMPPKMEDTRKVWDVVSAALVRVPAAEIDAKAVCQMLNAVNALARTLDAVTESQIRTHALEAAKSGVFGHGIAQGGPGYGASHNSRHSGVIGSSRICYRNAWVPAVDALLQPAQLRREVQGVRD